MQRNWNSHTLLVECKMAQPLCKILDSFLKVKHTPTLWSSYSAPMYLPKRKKSIYPCKDLYVNVCNSFIRNSLKLEITQTFINRCRDKWIVGYLYGGTALNIKRDEWLIHATTWMNPKLIMLWERSQTIMSIYCVILFLYNSKNCKITYSDWKHISNCLGQGCGGIGLEEGL